jgi:hypothetical protein
MVDRHRRRSLLVGTTIGRIESAQFHPAIGTRILQNPCVGCSHLRLCFDKNDLIATNLVRKSGATDSDWLDVLVD